MTQHSNLLRLCGRVLIWTVFAGIITDLVVSKTVTRHPNEHTVPCDGKNCDHADHKTDPAVQEMHQQQNHPHDTTEGQNGHNIDPDSLLHPAGGGHVHDAAHLVDDEAQNLGADAPDVGKELHGGVAAGGAHKNTESDVVLAHEEIGPDMDATLHGGQKHVHAPATSDDKSRIVEHEGIGVDPEEILHGGKDAHTHGESDQAENRNSEGNFDLGTDIEAMLHGGDQHVHSPDRKPERGSDDIPEVPIGASDPEAFLHDGNGHIHAHGGARERNDPNPHQFGAADPEEMLHGKDDQHVHTVRQAMDGSRPLPGSKDPDVMGMDVNPMEIRVGTLRPEDTDDYHKWKTEKEKRTKDPSQTSGWLSGFSYIKDALLRDLEVVRKRYLPSIFGQTDDDDSISKGSGKLTHDEA